MLIEDSFTVRTPVDRLWSIMQDVEAIAPCLPGAELTEVVDERTWKGRVHVKLGPVQMAFAGTVVMDEVDDVARRARLSARGTEQRGRGAATASVESWLEPAEDGATTVTIRSDITVTGAAAQLSRGLLPEVSRLLTRQFAECLQAKLEEEALGATSDVAAGIAGRTDPVATGAPAAPPPPRSVGALGLGLRALWAAVRRFVGRLLGRGPS